MEGSLAVIGEFGVMHRLSDTKGFSETEVPLWRPLGSSSANLLLCDTHNRSQGVGRHSGSRLGGRRGPDGRYALRRHHAGGLPPAGALVRRARSTGDLFAAIRNQGSAIRWFLRHPRIVFLPRCWKESNNEEGRRWWTAP